jgi:hypothetical protein
LAAVTRIATATVFAKVSNDPVAIAKPSGWWSKMRFYDVRSSLGISKQPDVGNVRAERTDGCRCPPQVVLELELRVDRPEPLNPAEPERCERWISPRDEFPRHLGLRNVGRT